MLKINLIEQEQHKYKFYSISPSGLETCQRQLCYKYNNEPKTDPPSEEAKMKMAMGNVLHDWLTSIIEGVVEAEEIHQIEKWGFIWRYKLDAVTLELTDDFQEERVINEIKTVPAFSYKMHKDNLNTLDHVRQIQTYMLLEDIPHGRLIYLNRDDGKWMAYDFYLADKDRMQFHITKSIHANGTGFYDHQDIFPLDTIIAKHKAIEQSVEKGELMPKAYQMHGKNLDGEFKPQFTNGGRKYSSDWQCKYCDWRTKCWKLDEFMVSGEEYLANFLEKL